MWYLTTGVVVLAVAHVALPVWMNHRAVSLPSPRGDLGLTLEQRDLTRLSRMVTTVS